MGEAEAFMIVREVMGNMGTAISKLNEIISNLAKENKVSPEVEAWAKKLNEAYKTIND